MCFMCEVPVSLVSSVLKKAISVSLILLESYFRHASYSMGCFMSCHPTRVIVVLVFDSVLSFARHACLSLVGVRLDQCDAYHTRSSDLPINDVSCLVLNKVAVLDPGDLKQNLVYGASPGDQMINAMVPHFHAKFMIHEWTGLSHGGRSSEPHRTAS